jgi:hypothetical protein
MHMKAVVAIALAAVVAGGGWFAWTSYEARQETDFATEAIQTSASQLERQLKAMDEDGITFAEYFKRSTTALEAMDETASALASKKWRYELQSRDISVVFVDQSKAMIRYEHQRARLMMEVQNARKASERADTELSESKTPTEIEWTAKRASSASKELIGVLEKMIENTKTGELVIGKMLSADREAKSKLSQNIGLNAAVIKDLEASLGTKAKDTSPPG